MKHAAILATLVPALFLAGCGSSREDEIAKQVAIATQAAERAVAAQEAAERAAASRSSGWSSSLTGSGFKKDASEAGRGEPAAFGSPAKDVDGVVTGPAPQQGPSQNTPPPQPE